MQSLLQLINSFDFSRGKKSIRPKPDKMNMKGNLHLQPSKISGNNSKDDDKLTGPSVTRLRENNL